MENEREERYQLEGKAHSPAEPLDDPDLKVPSAEEGGAETWVSLYAKLVDPEFLTPPTPWLFIHTSIYMISFKIEHQRRTQKHRYGKEQIDLEAK